MTGPPTEKVVITTDRFLGDYRKNRQKAESPCVHEEAGAGKGLPARAKVVEITKGCGFELEAHPRTGLVFVDLFLYTPIHFPFYHGFIPGTKGDNGYYLDPLVATEEPMYPMSTVRARTIGALLIADESGPGTKTMAVLEGIGPVYSSLTDARQLPVFALKLLEHSFTHYKAPEPREFLRVRRWQRKSIAEGHARRATKSFKGE
ncbi:MAG: inorganic diphosphatase [Nitrososphaerota archaeon]|nr:inorganic diphosphatase [Nitrososphaerota archaeon]MDG6980599.1 inorganic diphosphatase [Nitrososphaerota archaeon]MDG6983668.1 inorganic diphosphatase [Nitrososphaerota archaeon]